MLMPTKLNRFLKYFTITVIAKSATTPPTIDKMKVGVINLPSIKPPIVIRRKVTLKAVTAPYRVSATSVTRFARPGFIQGMGVGIANSKIKRTSEAAAIILICRFRECFV